MNNTMYNNIDPHQNSLEETKPAEDILSGEWMTVTEMGKLLGLQRTERYWLVHKNLFETKMILGKMRINVASFEDWYSRQIRYHKITGEEPGRKVKEVSFSAQDISELLGISEDRAYALIKENQLATETVNYRMRVPKELFDHWYSNQTRYLTKEDQEKHAELFESSISMPQMAELLGINRHTVYSILNSQRYSGLFEIIELAGKKRIMKSSFHTFLESQDRYHLAESTSHQQKKSSEHSTTEQDTPASAYLSLAEAAALAGISRQFVTKNAERGCFEMKIISGRNWISRQEFLEWLEKRIGNCETRSIKSAILNQNSKFRFCEDVIST